MHFLIACLIKIDQMSKTLLVVMPCWIKLEVPTEKPLFYKRHHDANVYRDWRGRMAWYQPELKQSGGIRFPHFRQAGDYVSMLGRISVSPLERLRCAGAFARWCWDMRRSFAMDLLDGGLMALRGRSARRRRYADEPGWR